MKTAKADPARRYRWLLWLYPARFREEYETPMERQFLDEYRDAASAGERARLWLAAFLDTAAHAPAQFAREAGRDLRHTLRVYRQRSASGVLALGALALAIGACTGVFGVVNAVLLRSLPFSEPRELAEIWRPPVGPLSGRAEFLEWQRSRPYLRGAAGFSTAEVTLTAGRDGLRLKVTESSANLFALLGVSPARGRDFSPDEDAPGKTGVAIIGHGLWQQAFGADPGVIGRTIRLNGVSLAVVGVAPPRFDYPGGTAVWVPSVFEAGGIPKAGPIFYNTVGRLSVPLRLAREMFQAEVARVRPAMLKEDAANRPHLTPFQERLAGPVRDAVWVLAGLVAFILLAACANVAQLLLSRASERREEFATRTALGASRARLIQQLITEALVITVAASALGLLVAQQICRMAALVAPGQLATQEYTVLDWRVALFAAGLASSTGIVFGVMPVLAMWRGGAQARPGYSMTGDRGVLRLRRGLVALQAGLTVTLAAASLAMGQSFLRLLGTDLGIRTANAVTLNVSLHGTAHEDQARRSQYYQEALQRLRAAPGVDAAGSVSYLPLQADAFVGDSFQVDSGPELQRVIVNRASPGYFRAAGTPLVAGRDFRAQEPEPAAIVNDVFARTSGLGHRIVGRHVSGRWNKTVYRVIGVVQAARIAGPSFGSDPMVYGNLDEQPPAALSLVARVRGDAGAALAACRDAVRAVDPAVPVYDVKTYEQRLSDALARPRFYTQATAFLGALALIVAAAGIYGSTARSVTQRRREAGIRMAIGATSRQVRVLVLRQTLAPVLAGAAVGIAGALATTRYVQHLITNAQPATAATCFGAAMLLLGAATAAGWTATARVLAIDPAEAVRAE